MTTRWTDGFLDPKRLETDPVADAVVSDLLAGGDAEIWTANNLFQLLSENDQPPPEMLPPRVRRYFEETAVLPSWADPKLVARGAQVFNTHGLGMVVALLCSGLPQCYAGARGAQVLYLTGRMVNQFQRRIVETAQFLLDVMAPNGLAPTGDGIRTTQKVRLVHAALRSFVERDPSWKREWGKPINQADLAATLMAFSVVAFDGIEQMGGTLTAEDKEACLHRWRVVGHVLGIQDEMLPTSLRDAHELWAATKRREFAPSEAGRDLTKALLDFVHVAIPGSVFDGMGDVVVRTLVGDFVSDMLGVPKRHVPTVTLRVVRFFDQTLSEAEAHDEHLQKAMGLLSRHLIMGLENTWRGGNRTRFEIPPSLRGSWGLAAT